MQTIIELPDGLFIEAYQFIIEVMPAVSALIHAKFCQLFFTQDICGIQIREVSEQD